MKRFAIFGLLVTTPAFALDANSTGADWTRASTLERTTWAQRLSRASDGDTSLAVATVQCVDEATTGSGAMVAQKLTELSAFCMTMLQSERSGQRKMARDKAVGPAISPEDRPPMPKSHKLVGIWISNRSNVIVRIVIYEHAGKVWMEYGGQGGVSELVRKKQGNLTVFRDKNPHPSDIEANLHWIMNADGSLEWHGSGRLQETARPIRK